MNKVKKVCIKCWQITAPWSYWDDSSEERWNDGTFECNSDISGSYRTNAKENEDCPYKLEHMVLLQDAEQENM